VEAEQKQCKKENILNSPEAVQKENILNSPAIVIHKNKLNAAGNSETLCTLGLNQAQFVGTMTEIVVRQKF